nr:HEPN domain-containing protein [uncultured Aminipila sp.]
MKKYTEINEEQFKQISGFLNIAYKDYLAARTLLNNGLLYRGIIIANTAVEKYLKAYCLVQGSKKKSHNAIKLYNEIKKNEPDLVICNSINSDFIEMISKAYELRYFDGAILNNGNKNFYLCVAQKKILAELDYTVHILQNESGVLANGKSLIGYYQEDLENKDNLLFDNNYLLLGLNKSDFIKSRQKVYEFNYDRHGAFELHRETSDVSDDGIFNIEKSYFTDYEEHYKKYTGMA